MTRLASAAAGIALALGTAACFDDGITGINDNPNAPTEVQPQFLFPQGTTAAVSLVRGSGFDLTFTGLWSQYYAKVQYVDEDWYQIRPATIDAWWSAFYSGGLEDLQTAIEQAGDRGGLAGPALVMRAWTVGAMTDIWGDIPFTEALQGENGTFTPVYDPQKVVYDSILTSLKTAAELLPGEQDYGNADPIYGGDNEKWELFANSLRARYGMRLSKVDPERAKAEVAAAVAAGVFTSNAQDAQLDWPGDGQNDNGWYNNFKTRDDHRVSKAILDTLASLSDPRIEVYAQPTAGLAGACAAGEYVGLPNGLSTPSALAYAGNGLACTSKLGEIYYEATTPYYLMTYAEVLFIQAEAAERGWISGSAADFYQKGIAAAMQQYGVAQADIDTYLAQARVAYKGGQAGLDQIALQKWIALFGQGVEGWSEWRRTGVPNLTPVPEAKTTPKVVARRLQYPTSEQSFNPTNQAAAEANQGGASMTDRVWWDKQ
ncbi:MAG TPA: SusD/RagB family nutrient-binding outer membrane lipoprotein [Gemmatimonadales bacterium]